MSTASTCDTTARLHGRARRLRSQAATLPPLLAETYRRRAAELDVQAWLEAVWLPVIDGDVPTGGPDGSGLPASAPALQLAVA
jgi:hypothetical protein